MPDPDEIWSKLEQDGEDVVRKKLAAGSYSNRKVPLVEEWLRRKDEEQAAPTYMYHEVKAPKGQVFPASDVPRLEKSGWVDSPQKLGKGLRSHFRRTVHVLRRFWLAHWKWLIGTVVVIALGVTSL